MRQENLLPKLTVLLVCAGLTDPVFAQEPDFVTRVAPLVGTRGDTIGQVTVQGGPNATVARITVAPGGLTPGWHGVHFHAVGDCSPEDQFRSARGIRDHVVKSHGFLNPEGPKEGDLPNIYVNPDGSANAEVSSLSVRMLGKTGLVESGSSLVIDANQDDHTSQPTGNSGARVACAALK